MQTLTTIPRTLHRFFTPKRFEATVRLQETEFVARVQTPDLTGSPATVWADWGAMYTCALDLDQAVEVTYTDQSTGRRATYRFSPPNITINAPAKAVLRARCPYVIEVVDAARCLRMTTHLDPAGEVVAAAMRPLHRRIVGPALMFREADLQARAAERGLTRPPADGWRSAAGR